MQSLGWYLRRLSAMSPAEVAWRVRAAARDISDRVLLSRRQRCDAAPVDERLLRAAPPFRVTPVEVGAGSGVGGPPGSAGLARLRERADEIAAHRLSYFDLCAVDHGHPIDWHRDHKAGVAAPRRYSASIDYRDHAVTGDCKFVWEPNRHQHLVVLARAYRATGERRYAEAVAEQLGSWLDQNPYGVGMNWRSPLELGVRLINWVWALDLIREADALPDELARRLARSVFMHVWEVARKYSRGSSANNHLIGEAAGVYVAASYFSALPGARRWRDEARAILHQQIVAQTHEDGGGREQAIGYQLFVMQFFTIAGLVGRWSGDEFPAAYWERYDRMRGFASELLAAGPMPMFGDYDDGYVLDLGGGAGDFASWLDVAAALRGDGACRARAGAWAEACRWLFAECAAADRGGPGETDRPLRSCAFPATGLFLLQQGSGGVRASLTVDCGELGLGSLAAHGHADALAITLRAFGREIVVDPGTYDYFTYPDWRAYFRSTAAHSVVEVDGLNQSEMLGPFMWGTRAAARLLKWAPSEDGGVFVGEHDGYRRLPDPVSHRRSIRMERNGIELQDVLDSAAAHEAIVRFHFAPECEVALSGRCCRVNVPEGVVVFELDPAAAWTLVRGGTHPVGGWVSRGYHVKQATTTLTGRVRWTGRVALTCRIRLAAAAGLEPALFRARDGAEWSRAADPSETPASVDPSLR